MLSSLLRNHLPCPPQFSFQSHSNFSKPRHGVLAAVVALTNTMIVLKFPLILGNLKEYKNMSTLST